MELAVFACLCTVHRGARYQIFCMSPAHNLLPEKIVCAEPASAAAMLGTMPLLC